MQLQGIQNSHNFSQSFGGKIADTYALRKFKSSLSSVEADAFEKYIKDVEKVDDGKVFEYRPFIAGNVRYNRIYELDKDGEIIQPAKFIDFRNNSINVFKQISNWYKHRI